MESDLVKEGKAGSRKRGKSVSKREAKQIKKYGTAPTGSGVWTCKHNNKTLKYCKVRPKDAIDYRSQLYSLTDKQKQEEYVRRLIVQSKVLKKVNLTNLLQLIFISYIK